MASQTSLEGRTGIQVAPRWVVASLLALATAVVAGYFFPVPVLTVLAVLAVLALAWLRPFWVFTGLLLLLPLHEQALRIATWQLLWPGGRLDMLSLWKEGIIALLFVVMILQHLTGRRPMRARFYHFDLWLLALAVLSAAFVIVANSLEIGVFGFRNYFEPMALLLLARLLPYSRRDLARLLALLTLVAAGVAAYGIYQAQFIPFDRMMAMGYVDEFGNLPFAFKTALQDGNPRPRAISTVTGPNQLAIYLNLFILLCAFTLTRASRLADSPWARQGRRWILVALLVLFGMCLVLTFSRGGLLALGVSLLAWAVILVYDRGIRRTWQELRQSYLLMAGLMLAFVVAGAGLVLSGFVRRIVRGLTGQDPAALGHLDSMDTAFSFIAQNPLGSGLGMAGPRALRFLGEAEIQHTESTYLQFGMETGVVGMLLLLIVLLSLLATLWRLRQRQRARGDSFAQMVTEVALVLWVGAMAVFAVTPLMQNFLVASYLWLMVGFAFHLEAYKPEPPAIHP